MLEWIEAAKAEPPRWKNWKRSSEFYRNQSGPCTFIEENSCWMVGDKAS